MGEVIDGNELAVVSGIQEYARRIRELRRDYGWQILSGHTLIQMQQEEDWSRDVPSNLKPDQYILSSLVPDTASAERHRLAKSIRAGKGGAKKKILTFLQSLEGIPVSCEDLRYVAKDASEWARRTRELRTEEGWPVYTRVNGRNDLPVGYYVLEKDRQLPVHDRKIDDIMRREVMNRDRYSCRGCGWNKETAHPEDTRIMELHHIKQHSKGGKSVERNLVTLCNLCHDDVHRGNVELIPEKL